MAHGHRDGSAGPMVRPAMNHGCARARERPAVHRTPPTARSRSKGGAGCRIPCGPQEARGHLRWTGGRGAALACDSSSAATHPNEPRSPNANSSGSGSTSNPPAPPEASPRSSAARRRPSTETSPRSARRPLPYMHKRARARTAGKPPHAHTPGAFTVHLQPWAGASNSCAFCKQQSYLRNILAPASTVSMTTPRASPMRPTFAERSWETRTGATIGAEAAGVETLATGGPVSVKRPRQEYNESPQ